MPLLTLYHYTSNDLARLTRFIRAYLQVYPDAKLGPPELYIYHPAMQVSANAMCVLESTGRIVGLAPIFPPVTTAADGASGPPTIWTILLAYPHLRTTDEVRELLYTAVVERAQTLKSVYSLPHIRLAVDMMVSQTADIDYLVSRGFIPFAQVSVMNRDASQAIPDVNLPFPLSLRYTKLTLDEELVPYIQVQNACFPENPQTCEGLRFLLSSPAWEKGTVINAYAGDDLIGSIQVYWDEPNARGMTDNVMVLPAWRGRGVAKLLVAECLRYCSAQQMPRVHLEVNASNAPAVAVYQYMGFKEINRELLLELWI